MPISVEISSWNVVLHSPLRTAETPPDTTSEDETSAPSKPHRIHVTHLSAHEGTVEMDFSDDRKVTMNGVAFESDDDGGGIWTTQLQATSIQAGTLAAGCELGADPGRFRQDQLVRSADAMPAGIDHR